MEEPELVSMAMDALLSLEAMGLLERPVQSLDRQALDRIASTASRAGIASTEAAKIMGESRVKPAEVQTFLERLNGALLESPMPNTELPALLELFAHDELARLLGVSESSLRRYASGARRTPDDLAARAHYVSLLVSYLRGAYNDIGVRRWFLRPRAVLGGRSPGQLLRGRWDPDSEPVRRVRDLARALTASPAT